MQSQWDGRYLDGRSAAATAVRITITTDGLHLQLPDRAVLWAFAELRLRQGHYAGSQVRLEHGTDPVEAVIITDDTFLEHLHEIAPGRARHVHNPANRVHRPMILAGLGLTTAFFLVILYRWGIPYASQLVATKVPVAWEEKLGDSLLEDFLKHATPCDDPLVTTAMNHIARRLNESLPTHPYTFKIHVVSDPTVNAFAAPGGNIVFFTGLLAAAENAEMVAGVMAHEMQHVVHRHVTQRLFADLSTSMLLQAAVGDVSQAMSLVAETARMAGVMHYSRAHEAEADRDGVALLKAAAINPQGLRDFFTLIQGKDGDGPDGVFQYLASHPSTGARIESVNATIGERRYHRLRLPTSLPWKTLVGRCTAPSVKEEPPEPPQ